MRINGRVSNFILSRLRTFTLNLQILFESVEFVLVSVILLKRHVFGQNHIFGYFSSYFVEITVVEEPMLGKENLLRQMNRFHIGRLFVEGSWSVGIDGFVGGKIYAIADFLNFDAVVLPVVLRSDILIFDSTHIVSFLHLRKQAVIEAGTPLKRSYLFLIQSKLLVDWVDDNVASFLHQILVYLVVPIVIFW